MKTKEKKTRFARERIKPRGLWGCMKGRIHYESDDIFNLGMPDGLPEEVASLKAEIAKEQAQKEITTRLTKCSSLNLSPINIL